MKKLDLEEVLNTIESEGFDYTFVHYDDFKQIKDKEFHKLRKEFLKSRRNLEKYLGIDDV